MGSFNQVLDHTDIPFDTMQEAYERAQYETDGADLDDSFNIAGYTARVRVVGASLAESVLRAFSHLRSSSATRPALTIDLWDQEASGVHLDDVGTDGALPNILMRASKDGRYVGEKRRHSVSWLDRRSHRIISSVSSYERLNLDERARPVHKMLSAWLHDRGIQFIHSGLVGIDGKGILFVGNGGAGKSTSSIACLRAGIKYLGDDFIGLEARDDGSYKGYGLFASCLLNVHHIKRFPDLVPGALSAHHDFEDKSVLYLAERFPGSLERDIEIRALVLPRVVDTDHTSFRSASKGEALLALAPTSVMFLPSPSTQAFRRLSNLVEHTPCFVLQLGRDVDQIPGVVRQLAASV